MKKSTKIKTLGFLGVLFGALTLSGCVANFCSDLDKANIAYPYEQGVTIYVDSKDEIPEAYRNDDLCFQPLKDEGNEGLWAYIPVNSDGTFAAKKAALLNTNVIGQAEKSKVSIPSYDYFKEIDTYVLKAAIAEMSANGLEVTAKTVTATQINPFSQADCVGNEEGVTLNENSVLRNFGYVKFISEKNQNGGISYTFDFGNWLSWNDQLEQKLGAGACPNKDFVSLYRSAVTSKVNTIRSCIATKPGKYGNYGTSGNWEVSMHVTTWGEAWGKGLFEGLIVYPVAWLVDTLAYSFEPNLTGIGQIGALIVTTIIVRVILGLLTFKSTSDQQRMQALAPELAKIQAKYPNSETNQAEKARLSQEQMALYKRHKINMFSSIIAMIIQFPVFISVWGALQGSAALASGTVLNLNLSDTIQSVLFNFSGTWYLNTTGWWTALILFILMAALQFLAMKLPQWINKAKTKDQPKLTANPSADKNQKTMKWMSYIMLGVTIVFGFALPSAMGVYWAIGALLSMAQTGIVQAIIAKQSQKKKNQKA